MAKEPKKKSHQYTWQLRKAALGLCVNCGKPAVTKNHCAKHALYFRERARKRGGFKKWSPGSRGRPPVDLNRRRVIEVVLE